MKLLQCPICRDVHGLIAEKWRKCLCGSSGGQYNADGMTATIGGEARVFGVGNFPFFDPLFIHLTDEKKVALRQKYYGGPSDAWWGEYPGDLQIFRIDSPKGPRLEVLVKVLSRKMARITITDKRLYTIDGKKMEFVDVPCNVHFKKKTRWS